MDLKAFQINKNNICNDSSQVFISLETELSETLYKNMKDFVLENPKWDQYQLINSAIASFLVQNGCSDNQVTEIYLNQLFNP
tara:strand:+ start:652 stop:897 length:246 start_codon:yes stop_codon:yes gene_type:complete